MSTPAERLRERIRSSGPIPFADLMAEALYGEGGHYRREESPVGVEGDYVTGSSLSPLFGQTTADLVRRLDRALGGPADVLEVGYGTGVHLQSLQQELGPATERRILALDRVERPVPPGTEGVSALDDIPAGSLQGLVFSYELFDAFPVHRFIGREDGTVGELWVDWRAEDGFGYVEAELSDAELLEQVGGGNLDLQPGQIADLSPNWGPFYRQLADRLGHGLLVTCDYGFERPQLLDRRVRMQGTLACYSRQRVHRDALRQVGDQDLTAHVDFTTLIDCGEAAGLETLALTRQARWLAACGFFDRLPTADATTRVHAMDLLSGEGMGEEIRVLVQGRGVAMEALFDLEVLGGSNPSAPS